MTLTGFGEGYSLDWYGSEIANSSIVPKWQSLLSNANILSWKSRFQWNNIRLGFFFKDLPQNSAISYQLDSTNSDGTLSVFDLVIDAISSAGYQVMPCCMLEGTLTEAQIQTLLSDWTNFAEHYKGDTRISRYQIANEASISMSDIWNIVQAIRKYEPNRIVVCPTSQTQEDIFNFCLNTLKTRNTQNLMADWHTSTYSGSTACMENSQIWSWPQSWVSNFWTYAVHIQNGEINAQEARCNCQTIAWLDQVISSGADYILWGAAQEYIGIYESVLPQVIAP
jgi:hypothetical protein